MDMISLNKGVAAEEMLSSDTYDDYFNEQISSVVAALNEVKAVCLKSDEEFVTALGSLLDENNELFTKTTTVDTNVTTTTSTSEALTEDVTVPGATPLA